MNNEEKKALYSFFAIYFISTFILISIITTLYYNKEFATIKNRDKIEVKNMILQIEEKLMHEKMSKTSYLLKSPLAKVALFDINRKKLYSNFKKDDKNFFDIANKNNNQHYHIKKLNPSILNVSYIMIKSNRLAKDKIRLITAVLTTMFISMIFILLIGYWLCKILLSPTKSRINKLNMFIRDSSHELNTPISALMLSTSSLKNAKEINPKVINHISVSAKLISQIYNTLSFIAFNDIDERFDERFDLKDLVQESVRFFYDIAANKDKTIKYSLQQTNVFLDKTRIQKIINNLLSNAIKYSYPKSEIEIILSDYTLSIINRGDGIKKEDQKAIFKRFERRDETKEGGFGIGLDIVKRICKEYDVKIEVESVLKQKTTFSLTFPKHT